MGTIKWVETIEEDSIVIEEWHTITVHKFNMGDVEDPEIYAAQGLWQWKQTEPGKFIIEYAQDVTYHISLDYQTYGYLCAIRCSLEKKRYSEFLLRFRQ